MHLVKELCLIAALISASSALPTVAMDPSNPLPQIAPQPRTFGALFGGYSNNYRYPPVVPDGNRGYGQQYGAAYAGGVYSPGITQQVVPATYPGYSGGYGGYGWRGGSDNRGYAQQQQQSGWSNQATNGWSYGR